MSNELVTSGTGRSPRAPHRPDESAAPSLVRDDDPFIARAIGVIGGALVIFGGIVLTLLSTGSQMRIGAGWATFWLAIGLAGLLFHAAYDRDIQFRRVYFAFSIGLLALGVFLAFVPMPRVGAKFGLGAVCLTLSLFFLLAFLRNEDDDWLRNLAQYLLGGGGALMALVGLSGAFIKPDEFLVPFGAILPILGLAYLAGFVGTKPIGDELAHRVGLAIGLVGLIVLVVAASFSVFRAGDYHVKSGMLLVGYGLLYLLVSALLCSDRPAIVITRRELGSYFYSPIAYIVLFGFTLAHWFGYFRLLSLILHPKIGSVPEPIVQHFVISLPTVILLICGVPALTMRLMSEEKRTGTLEVLFTSPVTETSLVLGKFLSAYLLFLLLWVPFGLLILSFRVMSGQPFDHYPLVAFSLVLSLTGAGFISIGVFFSSVTQNQILSFVLTFTVLLILTLCSVQWTQTSEGTVLPLILRHISYLDLWTEALEGRVVMKFLMFPISVTILFLFLTVKVLEARKWL